MKYGEPNDAGVFYATKGYYKGKEVVVTHHDGAMVWIEDYPVGKDPVEYGLWVPNDSVRYVEEKANESYKRRSKQNVKKVK